MPVISLDSSLEALTTTIVAEYPVAVRRLWDAYADPRQIEKFWGPPTWPATFFRHDFFSGGESHYVMTGPDGERSAGLWTVVAFEEGRYFEAVDGFADSAGQPDETLPTMRMSYVFETIPDGSRLRCVTSFDTVENMRQILEMGMEEGTKLAMEQIDDVLTDQDIVEPGQPVAAQVLDDTTVRLTRLIVGTVEQVWQAHHDPDKVRRWLLGPPGWSMPVCDIAASVGDSYRYEWHHDDTGDRFGFTGELLEERPPNMMVSTERMTGTDGPATLNAMTLTPLATGTLLSIVITYPDSQLRDQILSSGMTDGMETSYARLETEVLGV